MKMGYVEAFAFYLISFTVIAGAFFAIISGNFTRTVLGLFISFLSAGFLFFMLELPYLGVIEILFFSVALPILLLCVRALTLKPVKNPQWLKVIWGAISVLFLMFLIVLFIKYGIFLNGNLYGENSYVLQSVREFSIETDTNYGMLIVFSSMIFLTVMLGLGVIMSVKRGGGRK